MSEPAPAPRVAALVLAAGRSSRMEGRNKLLEDVGGEPMVGRVVRRLLEAPVDPVLVVTGHDAAAVEAVLPPRAVAVHNPLHEEGMGSSVRVGVAALAPSVDGVLICLGDMPDVAHHTVRALVEAFRRQPDKGAFVPVHDGRRGNPVLWASAVFPDLLELSGDVGARRLLVTRAEAVREVDVDDPGILLDADTAAMLDEIRADRHRRGS
jgi:molybdenum cofactor cytidylyltransferase